MSPEDLESLSRLLDGDLPADEAATLHERIEREPALAGRWRRLQTLGDALGAWADAQVPRHLHDAILDAASPAQTRPSRRWSAWLGPLLAAGLGLWVGRLTAPGPVIEQRVSGHAELQLHGARVTVDGDSVVRLEPQRGVGRVHAVNETGDTMRAQTMLAGGAGVLLTLTVQQGTAVLAGPGADEAPAVLSAPLDEEPARPRPPLSRATLDDDVPAGVADPSDPDQVAFENALLRGQLAATEGVAQEWPGDVSAPLRPDALRQALEAHLGERGEILTADCEEYPCLHFVAYDPDLLDVPHQEQLEALIEAMTSGYWEGGRVPNVFVSGITDESGRTVQIAGVAVQTDEDLADPDLQKRLEVRGRRLLEEAQDAARSR